MYIMLFNYIYLCIILHQYYFLKIMYAKIKNDSKLDLGPVSHQFPTSEIYHLVHKVETRITCFVSACIGPFRFRP